VVRARADEGVLSRRRRRASVEVGPPASDAGVLAQAARMEPPAAQARQAHGGRRRLRQTRFVAPADGESVGFERAYERVPRTDGGEASCVLRNQRNERGVAPADERAGLDRTRGTVSRRDGVKRSRRNARLSLPLGSAPASGTAVERDSACVIRACADVAESIRGRVALTVRVLPPAHDVATPGQSARVILERRDLDQRIGGSGTRRRRRQARGQREDAEPSDSGRNGSPHHSRYVEIWISFPVPMDGSRR